MNIAILFLNLRKWAANSNNISKWFTFQRTLYFQWYAFKIKVYTMTNTNMLWGVQINNAKRLYYYLLIVIGWVFFQKKLQIQISGIPGPLYWSPLHYSLMSKMRSQKLKKNIEHGAVRDQYEGPGNPKIRVRKFSRKRIHPTY